MIEALVSGTVTGASYAIIAVCLVVLYRLAGVVNLGQAALGALGAYFCYTSVANGIPLPVALTFGLLSGAILGSLTGWIIARFFAEPGVVVRSVISIVLLIVLLAAGFRMFGNSPRVMPAIVPEILFTIAGVRISLSSVVALGLAFAIAVSLSLLLRFGRWGLLLQAMSERGILVQLHGVNTPLLTTLIWAACGALSTLALLLVAPGRNPTFETMSFLVVPALAASLVGAFTNAWVATSAGLAIGALEGIGARIAVISDYRGSIPFIVILLSLIWLRRRDKWDVAR